MSENDVEVPDEDFDYGDYDLEDLLSSVTTAEEALPYPDAEVHDDETTADSVALATAIAEGHGPLGFTNFAGVTPAEAIAKARLWSKTGHWCGVGMCLATVRQYYGVPSGVPTAAASYFMSNHKRGVSSGSAVPRGVPVYWTGGSRGAGHIAISVGGGYCLSTDWKRAGKIDYAKIDDITRAWNLDFRGYTWEVNGRQVWAPPAPIGTVRLSNLKPGKRNKDVLQLKKRLHAKGYKGFILKSDKFGAGTRAAYRKYQQHLGYSGSDADGIPGKSSLRKLGFRVLP